ncbi:MAG: hypothetical protein Q9168_005806 [Polycauliona sp. 1 TL-2023]
MSETPSIRDVTADRFESSGLGTQSDQAKANDNIMSADFALRHMPPLLVATALTFDGLIPFFNPEYAILEFSLPKHIAVSKPAQSVMIVSSARITAIGIALFTFYLQGHLEAVDTILLILEYVGPV